MAQTLKLIDRLRGIYTIPVNDGGGLLNGKDTFTRTFPVPPINVEAAGEIETLETLVRTLAASLAPLASVADRFDNRKVVAKDEHALWTAHDATAERDWEITVGHARAARAALSQVPEQFRSAKP